MQSQNAFRSHAFCKPRFLDGQGDESAEKRLAWKGTVASRIRSLNDMNNATRASQTSTHSGQKPWEEVTRSNRPMHAASHAPTRSDESYGSSGLSGRTNPFVRHSPPRSLQTPLKPERISHSNVPVRSPAPSLLIQRPTFFEEHNRAAARGTRSPAPDTDSRQGFGRQQPGNHFRGAELASPKPNAQIFSPTHAHATARRFEELEARRQAASSDLERDARRDSVTVGHKAARPSRKSQPDLRSKDDPVTNVLETERDSRHSLTAQKASLPGHVRPTSPSIGIGPRTSTFGKAGRVRSVSPGESGQAKTDRVGRNQARLEGIESMIQDIDTTSARIESTAHKIRSAAHIIGLLSSSSTIPTNEARLIGSSEAEAAPQSPAKLRGRTPHDEVSSSAARMRKNTHDLMLHDGPGTSSAPEEIDSIDSILAKHDAVVDHVIEQLQACGHKLQTIRSLSQQFTSIPGSSSSMVGQKSDSASSPTAAQVSLASHIPPASINDPPALQRKRMRSIPDLIHLVDDAGEKFGLNMKQTEDEMVKEMAAKLHDSEAAQESGTFPVETDLITLAESQGMLPRAVAILPAEPPTELVVPSATPHLSIPYSDRDELPRNDVLTSVAPLSPPKRREDGPIRRSKTRLNTTLPIPTTPPSPHPERNRSPLQGGGSAPSSPCLGLATRPSSVRRRHHHRQPSSYLSAKRGIDSSTASTGSTATSVLDSLRPTPTVYFPYQHLPSATSSAREVYQQDGNGHIFQTQLDDPRGPISRPPETPPPPAPLFSMSPEAELGLSGDRFSPALPPEAADYRPSTADLARGATRAALEREHKQFIKLTALSIPIPMIGQVPVATNIPSEDMNIWSGVPNPTTSAATGHYPLIQGRRPAPSTTRKPPATQQAQFLPSEDASKITQRPKPPPRRTASIKGAQSPTTSPSHASVFLGPESPLFFQPSASHSPTTMATMAVATNNHPANWQLLQTPAPLASPLPSPMGPPPQFVRHSTLSSTTLPTPASKDDNAEQNDDADLTPVAAPNVINFPGQKQQQQHEQSEDNLACQALLNSTPPTTNAQPKPMITIQPSSCNGSAVSRSVSPSSSIYSSSSLSSFPPHAKSLQQTAGADSARSPTNNECTPPSPQAMQESLSGAASSSEGDEKPPGSTRHEGNYNDCNADERSTQPRRQSQSVSSYHEHQHQHQHRHYYYHYYQPLNVSERVQMLEESRKERMRVLRATGKHADVVRRFSGAGLGGSGSPGEKQTGKEDEQQGRNDGGNDGARSLSLLLGGPREQIKALGSPWW